MKIRNRAERGQMIRDYTRRDTITGLLVRRAFIEDLELLLRECDEQKSTACVAMLDVDNFKQVNDRGGHLVGDGALAALGRLLGKSFRPQDLRGRWGGDEFLLAFYNATNEQVQLVLDDTNQQFQKIPFVGDDGGVFHLSFSAGVAMYPTEEKLAHDLIRRADKRLYLAKSKGRKQTCIADS